MTPLVGEIIVPYDGLQEILANTLGLTDTIGESGLLVDLYQNDYQPSPSTTAGAYDVCDFTGYASATVYGSQFLYPYLTGDGTAEADYANNPISWQNNGTTQAVYGYLVRSVSTGAVLWTAAWVSPVLLHHSEVLQFPLSIQDFGGVPDTEQNGG